MLIKRLLFLLSTIASIELSSSIEILKKKTDKDLFEGLKLYSDSLRMIQARCLRNVDIKSFVEESLKSGLSKIDPHSSFISNYEQIADSISGNFSGIGVSVIGKNVSDENLLIIDVLDSSPAQKAGLCSGDRVLAVDGQKLKGLSCEEVVGKMRGKKKSIVKLKILRSKKILDVEVTRDTITDRSSYGYYFNDQKVYYINLKSFSENAANQMSKLIHKINGDTDCNGLILDLRANPGGLMEAAIDVASLFLPKNSLIVSTRDKSGEIINEYKTHKDPILKKNLVFFVLINNFTASAAEILAGALSHHSKELEKSKKELFKPQVFLLGTTTFGKGSVQEVVPLPGNHALKLTSMLYFLPNGESVQAKGVAPDFLLMPTRGLSSEEKFLYELYGLEKTMYHHITAKEVTDIVAKKNLEKHSLVDKKTEQSISKFEDEKQKIENPKDKADFLKNEKKFLTSDFGTIFDKLSNQDNNNNSDEESRDEQRTAKKRQQRLISEDCYVKQSLSMISHLNILKKLDSKKSGFEESKKSLEETFLLKKKLKMVTLE